MRIISRTVQTLLLSSLVSVAFAGPAVPATEADLVAAYLAIQEKLASDSAEDVIASANRLAAAARDLTETGKHGTELREIAGAAEGMKGSDIAALRAAFAPLSRAMAGYAEDAGLELGLFYCPMKDAYWLQGDDEIRNPYYGKAMLTCGEKAEKLKER